MDAHTLFSRLLSRQPVFDHIPRIAKPRICGTESEYGIVGNENLSEGFLPNGGLLYFDCEHPEYASPEVSNALDAVRFSEAGAIIARNMMPKATLYCHNNDWGDATFGSHESYFTSLYYGIWYKLIPFLVARTVMCGAGWVNREDRFELSQRASYMEHSISSNTTSMRGIINTRQESLSDVFGFYRLHLICGDATRNEVTTFLRIGTTALMIEMLEMNALPIVPYDYEYAWHDMQSISRKTSGWYLGCLKQRKKGVLRLLSRYCERAHSLFYGRDLVTDLLILIWRDTIEKLARNPMELVYRLDWVTKLSMLREFWNSDSCPTWDWLRCQDMEYHSLDPEKSLYYFLRDSGNTEKLLTPALIEQATKFPPTDTRAWARGNAVRHLAEKGSLFHLGRHSWDILQVCEGRSGMITETAVKIGNPFSIGTSELAEFKTAVASIR